MREPLPGQRPIRRAAPPTASTTASSALRNGYAAPAAATTNARHDIGRYAIATTDVAQRVELTDEQLTHAFAQYSGNLGDRRNHTVLETWDDTWGEPNCHGYSLTHEKTQATGTTLLAAVLQGHGRVMGNEVAVFLDQNDNVAHSGRVFGNGLRHLFKQVGVLHSRAGRNHLFGYSQRINSLDGLARIHELVSGRADEALRLTWVEAAERRLERAAAAHDAREDPRVHDLYNDIEDVRESLKEQSLVNLGERLDAALDLVVRINQLVKALNAPAGGSSAAGPSVVHGDADVDGKKR